MDNKEIERKYFVKCLPDDAYIEKIEEISQIYLYRDKNSTIRIRKMIVNENVEYIYTVKTQGNIETEGKIGNKYEIESNISKEFFEELSLNKIGNQINKTRYVIPIKGNLKVEIDVYHDYLEGFLTAEVEFPNEEEANNFIKPQWFGKEIGYKEFSNGKLSSMNEKEFKSKVSQDLLNDNLFVIEKLKNISKNY